MNIHLKALLITMVVLGFMFTLWWLAEYYPRQTLIVMLTIVSIAFPAMVYYLVYNALKNKIGGQDEK